MAVEFKEIELAARQLTNYINQIPAQIDRLKKEINLCDLETTDIVHLIELSTFNAAEGHRLAKDLQITQKQRRIFKNELESLIQLNGTITEKRTLDKQSEVINDLAVRRSKVIRNKKYKPRVRTDLTERFKQCNKVKY